MTEKNTPPPPRSRPRRSSATLASAVAASSRRPLSLLGRQDRRRRTGRRRQGHPADHRQAPAGTGPTEAAAVPGTFSYYDQVLDATAHLGAVPARFGKLLNAEGQLDIDGYFTLARGNKDQQPLEMTKWFDTNYHYLVPEIGPETEFTLASTASLKSSSSHWPTVSRPARTSSARSPTCCSPRHPMTPPPASPAVPPRGRPAVYAALLEKLAAAGASWFQLDSRPVVDQDTSAAEIEAAVARGYEVLAGSCLAPAIFVSTPYGPLDGQLRTVAAANIDALHIDVFKGGVPSQPPSQAWATRLWLPVWSTVTTSGETTSPLQPRSWMS